MTDRISEVLGLEVDACQARCEPVTIENREIQKAIIPFKINGFRFS